MKRMLPAALLALGIHAFILSMEFGWFTKKPHARPKSAVIIMTLAPLKQPAVLQGRPVVKKPVIKKTKPLKTFKAKVDPEKKNLTKAPSVSAHSQKSEPSTETFPTPVSWANSRSNLTCSSSTTRLLVFSVSRQGSAITASGKRMTSMRTP